MEQHFTGTLVAVGNFFVGAFNDEIIIRLIGALLVEQNDERMSQRGRFISFETLAPFSDEPNIMLSAVPAA